MKNTQVRVFRKTFRRFERLISDQLKDTCCCCGVTLAQCHALLEMEEQKTTNTSRLSKSLGLDKSTLSRTVDGLFNIGLVKRISHASDRRFTQLTLTKKGKDVCKKINLENDRYFKEVFKGIKKELHEEVIEHFDLLVQALAQRSGSGAGEAACCKGDKR